MNDIIEKVGENDPNFKVIDLTDFGNCSDESLINLLEKLNENLHIGNILWPSNQINNDIVIRIEDKIKENNWKFERFPNYFVHLLLSNHTYSVSENDKNVIFNDQVFSIYNEGLENWIVKEVLKSDKNGYLGAIYVNEKTKQMVVAHKGTYNLQDVRTDIDGVFKGLKVEQQVECLKLTEIANTLSNNGKLYYVSTTGHSLGVFYILLYKVKI